MIPFEEGKQLVIDSLSEFFPLWSIYLSDDDLENFLRTHKLVKTQAYCVTCGTNTKKEFASTNKPHMC